MFRHFRRVRVHPYLSSQVSTRLLLARFACNLVLGTSTIICREIPNLVKVGQQYRAPYIWSSTKYSVAGQPCKANPILRFRGKAQQFYIVDSDFRLTTIEVEAIVAFPLQQWLRERVTMLSYMYIACVI